MLKQHLSLSHTYLNPFPIIPHGLVLLGWLGWLAGLAGRGGAGSCCGLQYPQSLREGHLPQAAGLAGVVGLGGAVGPAEAGCRCLFQELYELQGQAIFFRPCRYRSSSKLTQIAEFCLLSPGLGLGLRLFALVCSPSLESWAATAVSHSPKAYGS